MEFQELSLDLIADLINESQHAFLASVENPNETASDLFELFKPDPAFRIWGFVQDGQPISYITSLRHKDPRTVSVGPMYVSEGKRGQGFGKKQLQEFVRQAKADGYQAIFSKTWGGNRASRATFEGLGFQLTKIKEHDRANGDSSVFYRLEI